MRAESDLVSSDLSHLLEELSRVTRKAMIPGLSPAKTLDDGT
jgi:hypothetical protein